MKKVLKIQAFKSEQSRFILKTGLKFLFVSALTTFILAVALWIVFEMNNASYISLGYLSTVPLQEAYYDFLFGVISESLIWIFIFNIIIFICGMYAGSILLRPFVMIVNQSQRIRESMEYEQANYIFRDFIILRRFSNFFFHNIYSSLKKKELFKDIEIPKDFLKIRKPPVDFVFLVNFSLINIIICTVTVIFFHELKTEVLNSLFDLSIQKLNISNKGHLNFLNAQKEILNSLVLLSVIVSASIYTALAIHLYSSVSGAAHAFFLTMKAVLKNNLNQRVHLVEYPYVRNYSRQFNKFLDYFCREIRISNKK
ncbi:MAG: hypothetical protein N4A33_11015 [Bacteriovoracaceae bacterium]|jgi:hypothetical protein|nr:hypothetical protein [Bacteriovoracaceae bacterium]